MSRIIKSRFLRILIRVVIILLLLFCSIILFIRSAWGQNIIVQKATNYISEKIDTTVEIEHLFVTFNGNIFLEHLYVEDQKNDTLIYSKELEVSVAFIPLIKEKTVDIKYILWNGVRANIYQDTITQKFNYAFIPEAFSSSDSSQQSNSSTPTIHPFNISFEDFDISYSDLSLSSQLKLGSLELSMEKLDLDSMEFRVDELLLSDTKLDLTQGNTPPSTTNENQSGVSPTISVNALKITKSNFNLVASDESTTAIDIGGLEINAASLNLENQNIQSERILIENTSIELNQNTQKDSIVSSSSKSSSGIWPEWEIAVSSIQLKDNKIQMVQSESDPMDGVFDPNHLSFERINLRMENIQLENKKLAAYLSDFSFQERSGIELKNLALDFKVNDQSFSLADLNLELNNTILEGSVATQFSSLNSFIKDPTASSFFIDFPSFQLAVQDAFFFQPDLASQQYIDVLSQKPVFGKLKIDSSTVNDLSISTLKLNWGAKTVFNFQGSILNVTNPEKMFAKDVTTKVRTRKSDLKKWVSLPSSIKVPDSILLISKLNGGLQSVKGDLEVKTSQGNISLAGNYSHKDSLLFDLKLDIIKIQLDELLRNEKLGNVTAQISASGGGTDINNLNANFNSDFKDITYGNNELTGISLNGEMSNGSGSAELNIDDPNVELSLKTRVVLDSLTSTVNSTLNVVGIDLYELGLSETDIRAKLKLEAAFEGNPNEFKLKAELQDGVAVVQNEAIPISHLDLKSSFSSDTVSLHIESFPINADFHSNKQPAELYESLKAKMLTYINDSTTLDSSANAARMKLNVKIRQTPFMTETLFKGLDYLDSTTVEIDFDESKELITTNIYLPSASYRGTTVDSLYLQIEGNKTSFQLNTGWSQLTSGMIEIERTALSSQLSNKVITSDFSILQDDEKWMQILSEIRHTSDTLLLHILPEDLLLAKEPWSVLPQNEVQIANKYIGFTDFEFSHSDQKVIYTNSLAEEENPHLAVLFKNFQLGDLLGFLNSEKAIAEGTLDGDFIVENPFEYTGLIADLNIPDFKILEIPLGSLELNANASKGNDYTVTLSVQGDNADLQLTGDYEANPEAADLHLDFEMSHLNVILFEELFPDYLSDVKGSANAHVDLSGKTNDLKYKGSVGFEGVGFKVDNLNSSFMLQNEKVNIDNSGIHLDEFKIIDDSRNAFTLNGDIITDDFTNPSFDLSLKAKDFEVINSTKKDNDLFYGKMILGLDLKVSGDLILPKVRGSIKVNEGSDLTYAIPQSELNIVEREGVVLFVNRKNPDDILTGTRQNENASSTTTGYDIRTKLSIDKNSSFSIIIDPKFNDNLTISGTGDFNFGLEPNGKMTLYGRYEVEKGGYETNLYNLIKRKFDISPGSSIVWNGDLYTAKMDLSAIYNVTTSASPLMTAQIAGANANISNQYQQPLPFLVYINIDGILVSPEISFNLEMPDERQGAYGGQVYQAIQQLNSQPEELNKQVFSLLVLNQFFPSNGSSGSNGGVSSIARDNVNQVLSEQLNKYSNKLLGDTDLQLGFQLNSYTENQAAGQTTNTQLDISASKQLLNDRLTVQIGSEVGVTGNNTNSSEGSSIVGNVSLEYMLTKDQRWRLLGFSKNEYDNLIDGQLTVSGISIVFVREFNKLRELWEKEMVNQKGKESESKK